MRFLDEFPFLVWRAALDGKCDYFNKAWLAFTGRTLEQELGDGWTRGVHPEDLDGCLKNYHSAFNARVPFQLEYRLRRHDGEFRWLIDYGSPLQDTSGNFAGYVGACYDNTVEKEAEEALQKSEQLFTAFMDHLPGCAWIKDVKGRYTYANEATARIGPYRRGWLGKTDAELWPKEIADAFRANDETVIATGKPLQVVEAFSQDGSASYGLATKFPIFDSTGAVEMVGGACVEITERLKAEQALRESEQRFRELAENIHEVFWLSNRQNTETMYVSPTYETIWGRSRDSLYAEPKSWIDAIHPEDKERVTEAMAIKGAGPHDNTYRIVRPDGSIRWIRDRGFPVRDESGAVVRFAGIAEDITEHKEAEVTLRQLAEVSAASSDYIVLIGPDFHYRYVNEAYLKARRFRPENMIGRHMQEIVGPERFEQLGRPQVEACLRGEQVETFEWTDFGAGPSHFLHVRVTPFREADGTISGAVMSGRDITERKRAEDAQHQSEQRFRQLAENINEVFWVWTAELAGAKCLYVSPAYATIWGRSCESLYAAPQSWREAIHPDDKARVVTRIAHLDLEKMDDVTYRIVRPDQSIRWIRDRIFPVRDEHGAVVRVAGIAEDITESKEAEVAIRKASRHLRMFSRRRIQVQEDERRRLSRELHDQIGQSLTAAKINVETLRAGTSPELLGRFDETTATLDRLLDQIRQISLDLRPSLLDDLGLVPALRSFLDEQGRRASLAVRFTSGNMPEHLDPEIQTTCFRIAQEAITNAVRHAAATNIDVDLGCENGDVRLLVRDNGKGFDIATAQTKSVDLGLIGMKERAALVGGRTKIKSSSGQGTTIEVTLPLALQSEPPDDFIEK